MYSNISSAARFIKGISINVPSSAEWFSFLFAFCGKIIRAADAGRGKIRIWSFGSVPKFEDCLQRLEQIVDELEKGNVPLEQALKLFEEGLKLSSSCRKELEEAEGKVEILLRQNGKLQPEPYEPATERAQHSAKK
ncbi:MAG TPA: exodeoxyribonuclease VII small subunit [Candidatus Angelobacter sp.]|nr:exodeoxyribonuclease VII small subunit [Candidatus Angelobacter sp.]